MSAPLRRDLQHRASDAPRRTPHPASPALAACLGALVALVLTALGAAQLLGIGGWWWALVLCGALVGAGVAGTRIGRALPPLAVASLALLAVVALTPLAGAMLRPLVRRDPLPAAPADAIVVLSSWIDTDGHLDEHAVDRLLTGADLYRRGLAPLLVLSRVRRGRGAAARDSDADQDRVLALLGRPVRLARVDAVRNTHDEAVRVAALGVRRVLLVTSPAHTRRACASFEAVGLRVACVPSAGRDLPLRSLRTPDSRVRAFRQALYERLATLEYRARSWIP